VPTVFEDHTRKVWRRSQRCLGQGAFGQVWLGMGDAGTLVALKTISVAGATATEESNARSPRSRNKTQGSNVLDEVLMEVRLLSNLRDENIVGYVGSSLVGGFLVIIMEYVPGGSLASLLNEFGALDIAPTQRYIRDILRGLVFLHSNDVIHQDIKPHNVLLMIDGQCKLTDFGASTTKLGQLQGSGSKIQGTPLYMAPEQTNGKACTASDLWAVGILTYQLLTGKLPYPASLLEGSNIHRFMYTLGRDPTMVPTLDDERVSSKARAFCESVFRRDPQERPTAEQLLSHPFLLA